MVNPDPKDYWWDDADDAVFAEHWPTPGEDNPEWHEARRIAKVLQEFYLDWRTGRLDLWRPDPLFKWDHIGRDVTDHEIDIVLEGVQEKFEKEVSNYTFQQRGYQQILPFTEFDADIKRALVQRLVVQLDMTVKLPSYYIKWGDMIVLLVGVGLLAASTLQWATAPLLVFGGLLI